MYPLQMQGVMEVDQLAQASEQHRRVVTRGRGQEAEDEVEHVGWPVSVGDGHLLAAPAARGAAGPYLLRSVLQGKLGQSAESRACVSSQPEAEQKTSSSRRLV